MKKIISSLLLVSLFLTWSCQSTPKNQKLKGGSTEGASEGWKDSDTFIVVVTGGWDRARYYIEGEAAVAGKEAKSSLLLQQDSKTAAKLIAMNQFQEKMGAYIKSKTGVEDGKLIGQVIQSSLEGTTISPNALETQYSDRHDARVTYEFKAKGLKATIDKLANEILAKGNQQ